MLMLPLLLNFTRAEIPAIFDVSNDLKKWKQFGSIFILFFDEFFSPKFRRNPLFLGPTCVTPLGCLLFFWKPQSLNIFEQAHFRNDIPTLGIRKSRQKLVSSKDYGTLPIDEKHFRVLQHHNFVILASGNSGRGRRRRRSPWSDRDWKSMPEGHHQSRLPPL